MQPTYEIHTHSHAREKWKNIIKEDIDVKKFDVVDCSPPCIINRSLFLSFFCPKYVACLCAHTHKKHTQHEMIVVAMGNMTLLNPPLALNKQKQLRIKLSKIIHRWRMDTVGGDNIEIIKVQMFLSFATC